MRSYFLHFVSACGLAAIIALPMYTAIKAFDLPPVTWTGTVYGMLFAWGADWLRRRRDRAIRDRG